MGKVFTFDEITNGEIPKISDFKVVEKKIRSGLESAPVLGAILCGSILGEDYSIRSDIDCVVVYNPQKINEVMRFIWELQSFAHVLHIPVEFILVDTEIARTKCLPIDYLFNWHLRQAIAQGGQIKMDSNSLFSFFDKSGERENQEYLKYKLEKIIKGIASLSVMRKDELHRFIQKVLEAPVQIARKKLQMLRIAMNDDSKRNVIEAYPEIAKSPELKIFNKIVAADENYTKELHSEIQNPNEEKYIRVIENLSILAWDTLEFVRLHALEY